MDKVKTTVKGWRVGDYIRQTSIVVGCFEHNRTFKDEVAYILKHDNFINFVIMVPGFWGLV